MNHQLKQITHLIKSNQRDEAHQALGQYMAEQPEDAWAWYLLSFTEPSTPEKINAAQRAFALNPTSEKIETRLTQLQAVETPRAGNRLKISLLATALGITIIAVLGMIALSQTQTSSHQLPTLGALVQSTSAVTPTQASTVTGMNQQSTEANADASPLPQDPTAETGIPSPEAPVNNTTPVIAPTQLTSQTRSEPAAITVSGTISTPIVISSLNVTAVPDGTTVPQATNQSESAPVPTATSTQIVAVPSPTSAPIQPTPPIVVIVENGVPMNTALNVGTGEMRVINAARPAENYIHEIGGTMPAAPSNQSWVLVEILVICQNQNACATDPSRFSVVGSSGVVYRASSQLSINPILGSSSSNGQLWGYVGFVVPNSETRLNLVLLQNNQKYVFSLQ